MKFKDFMLILAGCIFVVPVFFTSCDEGGDVSSVDTIVRIDTVYTSEKTVFLLQFKYYRKYYEYENDKDITVKFLTDNLSQLPELTVNDTTFKHFEMDEMYLTLNENIPFSDTLEYGVSIGDTSTSGTIAMPLIGEASCNGESLLVDDYTITVRDKDVFKLGWDKEPDYAILSPPSYWHQEWEGGIIDSNRYTIDTIDTWCHADVDYDGRIDYSAILSFDLEMVNGVKMVAGATPNVQGDYGNGYVSAKVHENPPDIGMKGSFQKGEGPRVKSGNNNSRKGIQMLKEKYELLVGGED